jgi:Flp pilus assembly protein TadD
MSNDKDLNEFDDIHLNEHSDDLDEAEMDDLDNDILDDDFEDPAPKPKARSSSRSVLMLGLLGTVAVLGGGYAYINMQDAGAPAISYPPPMPAAPDVSIAQNAVPEVTEAAPSVVPPPLENAASELPQPVPILNAAVGPALEAPESDQGPAVQIVPPPTLDVAVKPAEITPAPVPDVSADIAKLDPALVPSVVPDKDIADKAAAEITTPPTVPSAVEPTKIEVSPVVAAVPEPAPVVTTSVPVTPTPAKLHKDTQSVEIVSNIVPPKDAALSEKSAHMAEIKSAPKPEVKPDIAVAVKPVTKPEPVVTKSAMPPSLPVQTEVSEDDIYLEDTSPVDRLSKLTERNMIIPTDQSDRGLGIDVKNATASDPEGQVAAANRALELGRYDAALEMFNAMYKKNPRDERVLMGRAVALQKTGQADEALSTYDKLVELNPDNEDVMTNMLGLLRQQYPSVALQKLLDLRQRYPNNSIVAAQTGLANASIGNLQEGYRYLQIAGALQPDNPKHFFNMAVIAERMGQTPEAISAYEKALQADALNDDLKNKVDRDVIYDRLSVLRQK